MRPYVLSIAAILKPPSTEKYSVVLAAIRSVSAVAVGFLPMDMEQIALVLTRINRVSALNAFEHCTDALVNVTVCSAMGGNFAELMSLPANSVT